MPALTASAKPVPKVTAAGLGGLLAALVIWGLKQFAQVDAPADVAAAITTVCSFAAGYMTPAERSQVATAR